MMHGHPKHADTLRPFALMNCAVTMHWRKVRGRSAPHLACLPSCRFLPMPPAAPRFSSCASPASSTG